MQKWSFKEMFPDSFAICGKKKQKSKDTQDAQKQPQCVRSLQLKSCPNLSKLKGSTLQEGHLFNFLSFKDKKKSFSILFWKFYLFGGHIGYFFPKLISYNEKKMHICILLDTNFLEVSKNWKKVYLSCNFLYFARK